MMHYIPYARTDLEATSTEAALKWIGVEELLERASRLSPDDEFKVLLMFLVEFAGGLELAQYRMQETIMERSAISYSAYATAVQMLTARIEALYDKGRRTEVDAP